MGESDNTDFPPDSNERISKHNFCAITGIRNVGKRLCCQWMFMWYMLLCGGSGIGSTMFTYQAGWGPFLA